ncbi:MAG: PSD1 and planctomycete cytochrome C domain-containing protein [Pirellulaceae bacterium]
MTVTSSAYGDPGTDFFENKIRPVLVQHCYKCHSTAAQANGKLKGGLLLDDRDVIRRGGESGPAVVPGNEKKSLLLSALRHEDLEMPPKGKLPASVIADFSRWIKMGAPDPRDGVRAVESNIDLEKGRQFWSFQAVEKPVLPTIKDTAWSTTGIDRLIAARLQAKKLQPVGLASPELLVRRLYLDLIGLPPAPEPLAAWIKQLNTSSNRERVLENLVDSLLESPQFGERWGRHWLDVARYAESNGNSRNATFPHAWRYRDYVIDALNADTPYDRFITQQIAGDLLPHETSEQRNANLVATGFLALASKPVIRGKRGGFVPDIAADQIEVTTRAFLGLTVSCARCHDHKFDPIPTTDYYGLAGIFASSQTLYGGGGNSMGGAPATGLHQLVSDDPVQNKAFQQWQAELAKVTKRQRQVATEIKKMRPRPKKGEKPVSLTPDQKERLKELNLEKKKLAVKLKKLRANSVASPQAAMGIRDTGKVTEVPIYVRGVSPKGSPISRRLLTVLSDSESSRFHDQQSGRLELAEWLTSPDNPLTARVMANRIWQHLLGIGIVRTPDNFGVNGTRPSDPDLLDYLAAVFMENNWSVKRLVRRIVLTRTYQLSAAHHPGNYQVDPDNIYLWRHSRKRLEAEVIRDAILAASGTIQLDPPQGSVVTMHGGKLIQDGLTPDKIHKPSNHRSVYLPILRNGLPEVLEVFDVADPSLVVGQRNVTIVPAQDLYLMNNPFVIEKSVEFAQRLLQDSDDDNGRIELAYQIALSRLPTSTEQQKALRFVKEIQQALPDTQSGEQKQLTAWTSFCQALFVSSEFRYLP